MVTGLVTVNGDSRTANSENIQRNTAQPNGPDENYTMTHANKTINPLQQLERDHAKKVGYYEPATMTLDHLAFSCKLSAAAVTTLGGPSKAYSDDLLL